MKKSVFLMILITVLAWGATLWLDPPAPNMRSLMHEVYYLDDSSPGRHSRARSFS